MGKVTVAGAGGGADLDVITAVEDDVLVGKVIVGPDGEPMTGTLEVQSVVSFSVAQYSNLTLIASWATPIKGPWSGLRIMCKQGSYPNDINDGTLFYEGIGPSVTKALAAGTWYFKAWNYITTSIGRIYGGGTPQAVCTNIAVKGSKTFTSSTTFAVPASVRSIQVFCVGGGGGGGAGNYSVLGGGGGAGGRTITKTISVTPGQVISVTIGGGGGGGAWGGNSGGTTAFGSVAAGGGGGGYQGTGAGSGGSGGGGGGNKSLQNNSDIGGDGGSNGSRGQNSGYGSSAGAGQGTTTRAFGISSNTLYSGGGGGGGSSRGNEHTSGGYGGNGGGAGGGLSKGTGGYPDPGKNASSNTGGGGGGGGGSFSNTPGNGGNGGSGICIIRWGY